MDPINIAKPQLGPEEVNAVTAVLLSGKLAQGEQVAAFEKAFASYIGVNCTGLTAEDADASSSP